MYKCPGNEHIIGVYYEYGFHWWER